MIQSPEWDPQHAPDLQFIYNYPFATINPSKESNDGTES